MSTTLLLAKPFPGRVLAAQTMHPVGQISPEAPKSVKVTFSKAYSCYPAVFFCFGFRFWGAGPSKLPMRVALGLLKITAVALVLVNMYTLYLKSLKKVKSRPKKVVYDFYLRTELADLIFAVLVLMVLFVHEKSLVRFFSRALFRTDGTRPKCVRIGFGVLMAFWILFAFAVPIGALAGLYIADLGMAMMKRRFDLFPKTFAPQPGLTVSTLFCGLYALVCFVTLHQLSQLRARTSGGVRSLDELEKLYRTIHLSVDVLETAFSGVLPLLYFIRFVTLVLWTQFLQNEPGKSHERDARRPYLIFHVVQLLCLLIPPIVVNAMLQSSLNIEIKDQGQKRDFPGAYTASLYNSETSVSPRVQLWTIQMVSNPTRLTAGGSTINAWLFTKGLVFLVVMVWIAIKVQLLDEEIKKIAPK